MAMEFAETAARLALMTPVWPRFVGARQVFFSVQETP
jgi:hypothetical protein